MHREQKCQIVNIASATLTHIITITRELEKLRKKHIIYLKHWGDIIRGVSPQARIKSEGSKPFLGEPQDSENSVCVLCICFHV